MPGWLAISLLVIAAVAGLGTLDRLLLAMERRGWIYYRKKQGSRATLGGALLQVQAIFEPQKEHAAEVRKAPLQRPTDAGKPEGSEQS